jgi:CRP-like cAMP-binding protein
MVTIDTLREAELFRGLSDDELRTIAEVAREELREEGSIFHREGAALQALYFVKSGRVRIELDLDLKSHLESSTFLVDRLSDGEAFGWSSLVEPYVSTATVKAERDTEVVVIDAAELRRILEEHPHIGLVVFRALAKVVGSRLRHSWAQLAGSKSLAALSHRYSYPGVAASGTPSP